MKTNISKVFFYILGTTFLFIMSSGIFIYLGLSGFFYRAPQKPIIIHAEFPIKATYNISQTKCVYEDIVVCDYIGIKTLGEAGKYREWKEELKSGNERFIIYKSSMQNQNFDISIKYGLAEYYMGDYTFDSRENYEDRLQSDIEFIVTNYNELNEAIGLKRYNYKEIQEKFGISDLKIEYSEPLIGNCE